MDDDEQVLSVRGHHDLLLAAPHAQEGQVVLQQRGQVEERRGTERNGTEGREEKKRAARAGASEGSEGSEVKGEVLTLLAEGVLHAFTDTAAVNTQLQQGELVILTTGMLTSSWPCCL